MGFRPSPSGSNCIGIAVKRVNRGPGIEQSARITARTECGINDQRARRRGERGKDFVQQHRNVRGGAHGLAAFSRASVASWRQAACANRHSGPSIAWSILGLQIRMN